MKPKKAFNLKRKKDISFDKELKIHFASTFKVMACSLRLPSITPKLLPSSTHLPPQACLRLDSRTSFLSKGLNGHGRVSYCRRKRHGIQALFGLGVPELAVIAGVAVVIFGPKKLPELGKSLGKTLKSFQQAAKEFETELKKDDVVPVEGDKAETSKASNFDEKESSEV